MTAKKKPEPWNERLNWLLEHRGVRAANLARACKMSRASMNEWTNGTTKNPRLDNFFAACDALKVRPRWLALGEPPMEPRPDDAPPPFSELIYRIAEMLELRSLSAQQKILDLLNDIPEVAIEDPTEAKEGKRTSVR